MFEAILLIIHNCEINNFRCHGNQEMLLKVFYDQHDDDGYCIQKCVQILVKWCPFCGYKPTCKFDLGEKDQKKFPIFENLKSFKEWVAELDKTPTVKNDILINNIPEKTAE